MKLNRFMVEMDYHEEYLRGQVGNVVSIHEDEYHISEAKFDDEYVNERFMNSKEMIDKIYLTPSNQSTDRDIEFELKVKNALVSLLERKVIEVSGDILDGYDGKILETSVLVDGKTVYADRNWINMKL